MSDPRDAWDDEYLDRMLERALAVEPSPELRARVRARVATEAVRPWLPAWGLACAGASAVLLAAAVIWWPASGGIATGVNAPAADGRIAVVQELRAWAMLPGTVARQHMVGEPLATVPMRRARAWTAATDATQEIDVRFDRRERDAFEALLAFARKGRLPALPPEAAVEAAPGETAPPMEPVSSVTVPPIEVAAVAVPPLELSSVSEGEPQ